MPDRDVLIRGGYGFGGSTPAPPIVVPTDVAGLLAWYDCDASRVTLSGSDVTALAARYEGVPFADCTGPSGSRPIWGASVGALAAPGIRFNNLTTARIVSTDTVVANAMDASQPMTAIVVAEKIVASSTEGMINVTDTGTQSRYWAFQANSVERISYVRSLVSGTVTTWANNALPTIPIATPFFAAVRYDHTTSVGLTEDGTTLTATGTARAISTCNLLVLGNRNSGPGGAPAYAAAFKGILYHWLLYTAWVSDADLIGIRNWFRAQYPLLP